MGYYGRAHGEADGSDLNESAAHTEQEKTFPAGEDSGLDMQLMVIWWELLPMRNPRFLKDCTPRYGPILEKLLKNPMLEQGKS